MVRNHLWSTRNNKPMLSIVCLLLLCTRDVTTTTPLPLCQQPLPPTQLPVDTCGQARTPATRVVGGTSTECRSKYPWAVILLHNSQSSCGGVIWDTYHVLTAAHCLDEFVDSDGLVNVSGLEIIAGKWERALSNVYTDFEQRIRVTSAKIHANYERETNNGDIALLTLARPIYITDTSMRICHPTNVINLPRTATVVGWGTTVSGADVYPEVLQEVDVNVYDWNDCYTLFAPWFDDGDIARYLHNGSVICGANGLRGGKDSCQGDGGMPLFGHVDNSRNYTLIGLVSHGYGCARPGDPGFYTYIPFYLQWIQEASENNIIG